MRSMVEGAFTASIFVTQQKPNLRHETRRQPPPPPSAVPLPRASHKGGYAFPGYALAATIALATLTTSVAPALAAFNYTDQDRQARWQDLQAQIFGTRIVKTDNKTVLLDAPETALDAALVPITITLAHPTDVKALTLVIDDNPSPVAARFTFGPASDPARIALRVRVNHLTDIHAIAETNDGALIQAARFVKASGGCSAPMGISDEEAMRGMGEMRLKLSGDVASGRPVEATLMIRHPNFNGMQMNEALQVYTPARFIKTIDVTFGDKKVFTLDTDISMSSNPVISFVLRPSATKGDLKIDVKDSKSTTWSKTFPVPSVGN